MRAIRPDEVQVEAQRFDLARNRLSIGCRSREVLLEQLMGGVKFCGVRGWNNLPSSARYISHERVIWERSLRRERRPRGAWREEWECGGCPGQDTLEQQDWHGARNNQPGRHRPI